MHRARVKYGHMVLLAIQEHNAALAKEAYEMAASLPSTTTVGQLQMNGYLLDGQLYEGSELVICFKDERTYLLKGLDQKEAVRARIFRVACGIEVEKPGVTGITRFELFDSTGPPPPEGSGLQPTVHKHFMIMPKYTTALESVPFLSLVGVRGLWEQMQLAIDYVHSKGFAHMDIKPANSECCELAIDYVPPHMYAYHIYLFSLHQRRWRGLLPH